MSFNVFAGNNAILYRTGRRDSEGSVRKFYNVSYLNEAGSVMGDKIPGGFPIMTNNGLEMGLAIQKEGNANELYRITFANGFDFYATDETLLLVQGGNLKGIKELSVGDRLPFTVGIPFDGEVCDEADTYSKEDGKFLGIFYSKCRTENMYIILFFTSEEEECLAFSKEYLNSIGIEYEIRVTTEGNTILKIPHSDKFPVNLRIAKRTPDPLLAFFYNDEFRRGIIDGFYLCKCKGDRYFTDEDKTLYVRTSAYTAYDSSLMFIPMLFGSVDRMVTVDRFYDRELLKIKELKDDGTYQFDGSVVYVPITGIEKVECLKCEQVRIMNLYEDTVADRIVLSNGLVVPYRY